MVRTAKSAEVEFWEWAGLGIRHKKWGMIMKNKYNRNMTDPDHKIFSLSKQAVREFSACWPTFLIRYT